MQINKDRRNDLLNLIRNVCPYVASEDNYDGTLHCIYNDRSCVECFNEDKVVCTWCKQWIVPFLDESEVIDDESTIYKN